MPSLAASSQCLDQECLPESDPNTLLQSKVMVTHEVKVMEEDAVGQESEAIKHQSACVGKLTFASKADMMQHLQEPRSPLVSDGCMWPPAREHNPHVQFAHNDDAVMFEPGHEGELSEKQFPLTVSYTWTREPSITLEQDTEAIQETRDMYNSEGGEDAGRTIALEDSETGKAGANRINAAKNMLNTTITNFRPDTRSSTDDAASEMSLQEVQSFVQSTFASYDSDMSGEMSFHEILASNSSQDPYEVAYFVVLHDLDKSGGLSQQEVHNSLTPNAVLLEGIATGPESVSLSQQTLSPGTTVTLKGHHGKYCADTPEGINCNRNHIGPWETFTVIDAGSGEIALRGGREGKYCADEAHQGRIICNRPAIGGWEKFSVVDKGGGSIALKGHGPGGSWKYCADEGHEIALRGGSWTGGIKCNRVNIGAAEKFTWTSLCYDMSLRLVQKDFGVQLGSRKIFGAVQTPVCNSDTTKQMDSFESSLRSLQSRMPSCDVGKDGAVMPKDILSNMCKGIQKVGSKIGANLKSSVTAAQEMLDKAKGELKKAVDKGLDALNLGRRAAENAAECTVHRVRKNGNCVGSFFKEGCGHKKISCGFDFWNRNGKLCDGDAFECCEEVKCKNPFELKTGNFGSEVDGGALLRNPAQAVDNMGQSKKNELLTGLSSNMETSLNALFLLEEATGTSLLDVAAMSATAGTWSKMAVCINVGVAASIGPISAVTGAAGKAVPAAISAGYSLCFHERHCGGGQTGRCEFLDIMDSAVGFSWGTGLFDVGVGVSIGVALTRSMDDMRSGSCIELDVDTGIITSGAAQGVDLNICFPAQIMMDGRCSFVDSIPSRKRWDKPPVSGMSFHVEGDISYSPVELLFWNGYNWDTGNADQSTWQKGDRPCWDNLCDIWASVHD